jgi:RNA polymerase sigma factor (TIGR02999 family)
MKDLSASAGAAENRRGIGFEAAHRLTLALAAARGGDRQALADAFALVYDEVKAIAHARLVRLGARVTLNTTAVVHEAYLKIARHGEIAWEDRGHFFAVASSAMRQVLIDHARRQLSAKRGGGAAHLPLDEADSVIDASARDLVALDTALARLASLDEQLGRVVEMRFFGGLSVLETAGALGVSEATVKRAWRKARAFLHRELAGDAAA